MSNNLLKKFKIFTSPATASSGGGGATVTASNGLTKAVNDIKLGGLLTQNTEIDANSTYYIALQQLTEFYLTTLNLLSMQSVNGAGTASSVIELTPGTNTNTFSSGSNTITESANATSGIISRDITNSNGSVLNVGYYTLGFFDGFSWSFNNKYQLSMSNNSGLLYDDLVSGRLFHVDHLTGAVDFPRYAFTGVPTDRHLLGINRDGKIFDIGIHGTFNTLGESLVFKAGVDSRAGKATLSGGTVAVANTTITANSIILATPIGSASGTINYVINPGVGFTLNSTLVSDTRDVSYLIIELS